ncbi:hypothetical protein Sj15T_34500 [Sphingobium sp. TA15]|uniref:HTH DNA binding domain-containing protein n=1 Tax=Sphingobium indicum (strain DSM 16413 / CCM 7287 / MTCC 6362 / UT26 / NBRC 101211 / UT26S) TaxID=452662 RepID=D4Z796_SPHIU|nr:hypothetical protein [Sphingobium indicum]BAI98365.1 hypothetical protein SJA_C2-00020 [Sphingobium indicum UT26S]BDD68429.1 hypothetical protein Sj15T_34500 [Sphingobium sp. TA15]
MHDFSASPDHALLVLGRLDGRLCNSPAADIWLARERLKGASMLSGFAGVPVSVTELQNWICGRTPPPRHSEGLNDPLSVAALFHFALSASDDRDPIARATLNISRTLLDDRKEAGLWAPEDLVRFGPSWRMAQMLLEAPYPAGTLLGIAQRLIDARGSLDAPVTEGHLVTTADGRQWRIDPRRFDMGWVLACHLPGALLAAGLSLRRLPSLVGLPRFLPDDAGSLAKAIAAMIARQAGQGLIELDRLEAKLARLPKELRVTRRSKAPLLMRLELAYPGLGKMAVARLLGISHQGATKLVAQVERLTGGH